MASPAESTSMGMIFHIPHASLEIPSDARRSLAVSNDELRFELLKMTDRYTDEIFGAVADQNDVTIQFPVSRLIIDPERFVDDDAEQMSRRGMGVCYTRRHDQSVLRTDISDRERLISNYYLPHHQRLAGATRRDLLDQGRALIIDCHSFPSRPLPYELVQDPKRPQICIGTDPFHTPRWLSSMLSTAFEAAGYEVAIDTPFSGSIVPMEFYNKAPEVLSVMIELRRDLYMDEDTAAKNDRFAETVFDLASVLAAVRAKAAR